VPKIYDFDEAVLVSHDQLHLILAGLIIFPRLLLNLEGICELHGYNFTLDAVDFLAFVFAIVFVETIDS